MNLQVTPEERDLILLALRILANMAEMKAEYESAVRLRPLIDKVRDAGKEA